MSELSAHDPQPTDGSGLHAAGSPAAQPAAAPQPPPADPAPDGPGAEAAAGPAPAPRLAGRGRHGKRLVPEPAEQRPPLTPQQRLLILDAWVRSGLPAADFAPLVGVSRHTLYLWKKRFDAHGPAGLTDRPRGAPDGSSFSLFPASNRRTASPATRRR